MDPRTAFENLRRRVEGLRFGQTVIGAMALVFEAGAIALVALAILVAAEAALRPAAWLRTAIVLAVAIAALAVVVARALRFARALPSSARVARRFERARPEVDEGAVVSALSLWPKREDPNRGYSRALIDAHLAETAERSGGRAPGVLEARPLRAALIAFAAIAGLVFTGRALAPDAAGEAFARLTEGEAARTPAVRVTPGDVRVVAGANIVIRAEITPPPGFSPSLAIDHGGYDGPAAMFRRASSKTIVIGSVNGQRGVYEMTLESVDEEFQYQIIVGEWESPVYRVTVDRAPLLLTIEKRYRYPAYSGLAEQTVEEGDGHVKALLGTEVALTVKSGGPISRGELRFNAGATTPLRLGARAGANADASTGAGGDGATSANAGADAGAGDNTATATLVVRGPDRYQIALADADGNLAEASPVFDVVPIADEAPIVTLLSPASDTTLSRDMVLDVRIGALDDFGISKIALVYSTGEGEERVAVYDAAGRKNEVESSFPWDVSDVDLSPGEVLSFYAEAWDNDAVSGPKRGVSRTITARFPTLAEIYQQVNKEEEGQAKTLDEAFHESVGLKEKVEAMTRDLKRQRDEEVSWQKKEEIEQVLQRQEEVAEELAQVAEALDQTMSKLEKNELTDSDVLEKLSEIRRLMSEVATDEMRAAMDKMRKAMEALDPKEIAEAAKNLKMSQEEFLKRLDRTIEMLKDVQRERKVDEMVKSMEDLLEKQESLRDATKDATEDQMNAMAPEQEAARKELDDAVEKMEQLAQEMKEKEAAAAEAMEKTAEELRQEQTPQTMSSASQSMSKGAKPSAQESQKKSSSDLAKALKGLESAQQQMNARRDDAVRKAIEKGIRDLIYLSKSEEGLVGRSGEGSRADAAPIGEAAQPAQGGRAELARRQVELKQGIERVTNEIEAASKKTMHIGRSVPAILRDAGKSAAEAAQSFSAGQTRMGAVLGDRTMVTMNAGLVKLLEAQKNFESSCKNGQAGGGECQNPGLNKAAEGQKSVNQGSQSMSEQRGAGGQRLTMPQRDRLTQMAAQQEAVRRGLEEFAQSLGNQENILGRLDKIAEEMKQSERDLREERPEDASRRGEKILQRLLDADKSFQRRGFKKERTSETARTGARAPSPSALSDLLEKANPKERDDILRTMSVRFPEEYEALIRAYFEALEKDGAGAR